MKTEDILNEREKTHGDFKDVAYIHDGMSFFIRKILENKGCNNQPSSAQILAINNICIKIARIVCGDPDHADHWDDIAGYAMLGRGKAESGSGEVEKSTSSKMEDVQNHERYAQGWNDGGASAQEIYSGMKKENEELIQENVCLKKNILGLTETINDILREQDSVWHDAEKCLPLLNKWVEIEYENVNGDIIQQNEVQLKIYENNYLWCQLYKNEELYPKGDCKVLKWRYDTKHTSPLSDDELCVICNDNVKADDYKYKWRIENKYLCRHCLARLEQASSKT